MRKQSKGQVFRITGARQGLDEDIRGRQRRYVISMSVRTVSVILAVTLWNVARPVAVVALVLGFILPYVAVVIANAGRENPPAQPSTFVPTASRPKLTAHARPGQSSPRTTSDEASSAAASPETDAASRYEPTEQATSPNGPETPPADSVRPTPATADRPSSSTPRDRG